MVLSGIDFSITGLCWRMMRLDHDARFTVAPVMVAAPADAASGCVTKSG
jgi:hypothetical protein